jgi:hypothetical protein
MSHSSRAKRMERHHKRARPAAMSLVSLMDIFTILVFFLLVNQSEVQALDVPKNIELPESMSLTRPSETVVVMVTPEQILVQGKAVANTRDVEASEELVVQPLREALADRPHPARLGAGRHRRTRDHDPRRQDRAVPRAQEGHGDLYGCGLRQALARRAAA